MLSKRLDNLFLFLGGLALFSRIFLDLFLNKIEPQGIEHLSTLINDLLIFVITFLFILKKSTLNENIRFPNIFWALGAFCLSATLSIFYSVDAPSSLLYVFDLWASFFFMLVVVNLLTSMKSMHAMIGILLLLTALICAHAAYEFLVLAPPKVIDPTDRATQQLLASHRTPTLFGWPNILAGFLIMTLPLTLAFLGPQRSRLTKFLMAIVILLALYALYITMTVSSWTGLGVAATTLFLILKKQTLSKPFKIWGALIIACLVILVSFTAFKKMTSPSVNSTDSRMQYITSSLCLIKLHPFIGNGWRSYAVANVPFIKGLGGRSFFAHNSYLQIWTELGLVGLMAFLCFLWTLGQDAASLLHQRHRQYRWLICGIIAGIIGCVVDNLFSYTMIKPQVALYWWVLCALLIALKENLDSSHGLLKAQATWKKIFLILTVVAGVMTIRVALAEYDFFTAVHDIHQGTQLPQAQLLCLEAKKLNPWDKKFDLARAYALYGTYLGTHDMPTLQEAHDVVLSTAGQVSLGFERDALIKNINDALGHP